jgi:hypothetical protein
MHFSLYWDDVCTYYLSTCTVCSCQASSGPYNLLSPQGFVHSTESEQISSMNECTVSEWTVSLKFRILNKFLHFQEIGFQQKILYLIGINIAFFSDCLKKILGSFESKWHHMLHLFVIFSVSLIYPYFCFLMYLSNKSSGLSCRIFHILDFVDHTLLASFNLFCHLYIFCMLVISSQSLIRFR